MSQEPIRPMSIERRIAENFVGRLLHEHPLPWHVVKDWSFEVIATDGHVITKYVMREHAEQLVTFAEELHALVMSDLAEIQREHPELFVEDADGCCLIDGAGVLVQILTQDTGDDLPVDTDAETEAALELIIDSFGPDVELIDDSNDPGDSSQD